MIWIAHTVYCTVRVTEKVDGDQNTTSRLEIQVSVARDARGAELAAGAGDALFKDAAGPVRQRDLRAARRDPQTGRLAFYLHYAGAPGARRHCWKDME